MPWSSSIVADHRVDLYTPSTVRFALLYLHDEVGQTLCDDPHWTTLLEDAGMIGICPHANESWWSNRIYREFDEQQSTEQYLIEKLLSWIRQTFTGGIAVAGIGMGGQGALRIAFKYPHLFRVVGAIDAAVDHYELIGLGTPLDELYDSREQCRQDGSLFHIHPSKQPAHIWFGVHPRSRWFRGNDRLHEKLAALGAPHHAEFDPSRVVPETLLRFVATGLEQESRRLL